MLRKLLWKDKIGADVCAVCQSKSSDNWCFALAKNMVEMNDPKFGRLNFMHFGQENTTPRCDKNAMCFFDVNTLASGLPRCLWAYMDQ